LAHRAVRDEPGRFCTGEGEKSCCIAGLDLSRRRVDLCVLSDCGELVEELAAPTDVEGLKYLVLKVGRHGEPVRGVIESRECLDVSLHLIDYLESEIDAIERQLRATGAEHPCVPLFLTVPRNRMGARVHDRRRDRRHHPLRIRPEAGRLHRPMPDHPTVRREGPPRPPCPSRDPSTRAGRCSKP